MPKKTDFAERAHTFLLCFLAFGMANLNLMMSIGTILLLIVWLYYPGPRNLWDRLRQNIPALLLIGLFLLHLIWLFNTNDFQYAFKDLRIKLPLLVFGLVLGTTSIGDGQLKLVFASLGLGILVATVATYWNYFAADGLVADPRSLVKGISHIRLSVLMVVFIAGVVYYWSQSSGVVRFLAVLSVANILVFFNLIQAATGSVLLIVLIIWTVGYFAAARLGAKARLGLLSSLIVLFIAGGFVVSAYYQAKFTSAENLDALPSTTALGNQYHHIPDAGYVENGHYIFINICRSELQEAWVERSAVPLDADLHGTLIRYLASKGLTKDRAGIDALTNEDVSNIEAGIPSIIYAQKSGLGLRFHTFLYSVHNYSISGNASGLSFLQRVVYWDAALYLITKSPILGTGTGDVKAEFLQAYEEMDSSLEVQYRNRAHNQFLTFFVSFGILGLLYFLMVFLYPCFNSAPDYLYTTILLILFCSCLTEDTLETQAGATIFAFFYVLLSSRERVWAKKIRA